MLFYGLFIPAFDCNVKLFTLFNCKSFPHHFLVFLPFFRYYFTHVILGLIAQFG